MKAMLCLIMFGLVALLGTTGRAGADVYQGAPVKAVVLPDDESGVSKVALQFDFSSLRAGENRAIMEALLDWPVSGVSDEGVTEYVAYPVTSSWSEEGIGSGQAPTMSETAAAEWMITPVEVGESGTAMIRLNLTNLVRSWTSGATSNYGIVVATDALSRSALGDQLGAMKLTVRYGFR